MPAPARDRLSQLHKGLLRLHKTVLESERASYERDIQRITTTGQYLDLVLNDPWFAWLRELSQFIVLVDEAADGEVAATDTDADRLIAQSRALLAPAEEGSGFGRRYFEALQRDPAVVLGHRDMLKVLNSLSTP